MIEDLEGATSEPPRRRHVLALSAAVAAVSLVMLFALVVPAPDFATPQPAASPAAHASSDRVQSSVSGPTMFLGSSPRDVIVFESPVRMCTAGVVAGDPRYVVVYDRTGQQVLAAYSSGSTGRSVPIASVGDRGTGRLTVSCATSDVFAPRVDVPSIAR